jgi:hypothetical protein
MSNSRILLRSITYASSSSHPHLLLSAGGRAWRPRPDASVLGIVIARPCVHAYSRLWAGPPAIVLPAGQRRWLSSDPHGGGPGSEGPRAGQTPGDQDVSKFRERLKGADDAEADAEASARPQEEERVEPELSLMERAVLLSSKFDPPPGQRRSLPSGKSARA